MRNSNIKTSGFTLAKEKELVGDDFYDVKLFDDIVVAVLCDGVGSANEGATAAKRVVNHIMLNFKNRPLAWSIEKSIKNFISSINSILYQESMVNYQRVELITTVALVVIKGNRLYGANVGDSRVYLQRENRLTQISYDHLAKGDNFDGVLSKAIGISDEVEPYYFENIIRQNDKILLCSDGLYNILDNEKLNNKISLGANLLVKEASRLCEDNLPDDTTAIIIDILRENPIEKLKKQELIIPTDLKNGDNIDGFVLEKPLIANKRTWLCEKSSKKYVIKFAPVEAIEDEIILDLFVKEAWNSKRLKAGFFPKAVIPKNRTYRYYIMSFLDGVTLEDYIKKQKLHIDDTILLAKTLLNMSQYLLKFDLVHGDIKPENIIIIKRGDKSVFKIIDFGSMCQIYNLDTKAGTPSYLAPERFSQGAISETTEIFAIGVTLYRSLTQKFPYKEIEPFSNPTFSNPKLPTKFNNKIPSWLEAIILRSVAVDTTLRYTHYSQMLYELKHTDKVKPFFSKNTPLLERNPLRTYQIAFYLMLILNIYLLIKS